MKELPENFAPYTSIGNMLMVLKRIRDGWVPSHVDSDEIQRVGVSKGNATRTINALQFLEMLDEEEATTQLWKAIATATSNEYHEILAEILRNSYSSIFEIYPNPSDATDIDIDNAFRKMEPLGQKARMITLFRGLCQEANLIVGDPLTRKRTPKPKSSHKTATGDKVTPNNKDAPKRTRVRYTEIQSPSLVWFNDLELLLKRLPNPDNRKWTSIEKERWLNALNAMLDLLIEVEDEIPF